MKHPRDMTTAELLALRAVNQARGKAVRQFFSETGALWHVCPGLGEPWARVYAGFDYDHRTLPLIVGPGFSGRRHGLNPARMGAEVHGLNG